MQSVFLYCSPPYYCLRLDLLLNLELALLARLAGHQVPGILHPHSSGPQGLAGVTGESYTNFYVGAWDRNSELAQHFSHSAISPAHILFITTVAFSIRGLKPLTVSLSNIANMTLIRYQAPSTFMTNFRNMLHVTSAYSCDYVN